MFEVIFVVQPKKDRKNDYLDLAKQLKPILQSMDGFIDNERFESKRDVRRILSLSTWRDEKAVVRWRTQSDHHDVQGKGRFEVFEDYSLRVGDVTADTHPPDGGTVDEKRFDESAISKAKVCTITELTFVEDVSSEAQIPALNALLGLDVRSAGLVDHEIFVSIVNPGKLCLLADWESDAAARTWKPHSSAAVASIRHRHVRIVRRYGMRDRREAPQYFPDVTNPAQS
ncbi:MAG TPA: antibiotic biosynthesis monooxygenase [Rhodanobacteraceae bacterium]|jgi:heme-degrading monooxygenase HmoA|nr:antibiotic biosynthesis monooxygenase [Rhodanobacteraceae bacterium]